MHTNMEKFEPIIANSGMQREETTTMNNVWKPI